MAALIFYTDYDYCIYERLLETYKYVLPQEIINKVYEFRNWKDRQAFLLGKLIIWKGLKYNNYGDDCLFTLQKNSYGKPFIDQKVFFNLSHSGQYVICAFHKKEIGIDIEEISDTETDEFENIFSDQEKLVLNSSPNPLKTFFRYWTIKESVIKAEGKGFSLPLELINISGEGTVQFGKKKWHVKEIDCFENYCCSIATESELSSFILKKVNL